MRILKKFHSCSCGFILLSLLCTNLYGGLAESYGFSALGVGRAGTFAADASGWTATFYNIGGLSLEGSTRPTRNKSSLNEQIPSKVIDSVLGQAGLNDQIGEIGITYIYQITEAKISLSQSQLNVSTEEGQENVRQFQKNASTAQNDLNYGILQMGMSVDLRPLVSTPYDVPLKLGMALSVRDNGSLASFNDIDVDSYNFVRYGREAEIIGVITGLGFQLWKDRLSVGVGGNMGLNGSATFNIKNVDIRVGEELQPGHEFKTDVRPNFSAVVGLVYLQPIFSSQEVRFGASYRQETQVKLDPIEGVAHVSHLNIPFNISLALLDFYVPNTYALGLSYRSNFFDGNALIVSYDQEFQEWSKAAMSSSKTLVYDRQNIHVPGLKDIFISRFSIEYHPLNWPVQVRSGYAYQPSFAPEQSGVTNFLDNSRHIMAFGFSLLFRSNLILKNESKLNIGIQYQKSTEKNVIKDTASAAQLNPNYSYSSDIFVVGADFVLTF